MNNIKNVLLTLTIVIALGVGILLYTKNKSQVPSPMMKKDSLVVMEKENDMVNDISPAAQDNAMMTDTRYIQYSTAQFEESMKTRRILFFYANWCPTCKAADANFEQNLTKIPEDSTLLRVNYNDTDTDQVEKDLAKKYEITYQHTFVQIDEKGSELAKWNGGDIEELLVNIK